MSDLLKHTNYLNTVFKSPKAQCSQATNCRGLMHAMQTGTLTNLCLALSFILTVVLTGQKSSELLFTLTLGPHYAIPVTEHRAPISIIIAWITTKSAILKHYLK